MWFLIFVIILTLIVLILCIYWYTTLPQTPTSSNSGGNLITCNQDDVLNAWITGTPNKPNCPPFTNNWIVKDDYILYQKQFTASKSAAGADCCYFSDLQDTPIVPSICVGFVDQKTPPTVSDLNIKPYSASIGGPVSYIVPVCDNNKSCIELIQIGQTGGVGIYKVAAYNLIQVNPSSPSPELNKLYIYLSGSCRTLDHIVYDGQLVDKTSPSQYPQIVNDILSIFTTGASLGFFPIPGINPPLASFLQGQSS